MDLPAWTLNYTDTDIHSRLLRKAHENSASCKFLIQKFVGYRRRQGSKLGNTCICSLVRIIIYVWNKKDNIFHIEIATERQSYDRFSIELPRLR